MDPFISLSSETRAQILILLRSEDDMGRLCQASPVMLEHFLHYKVYISREQLSTDLDNDLLQDAMAIVHFPTTRATPHDEYETAVALHMAKWSRRQFPNPLVTENRKDIVKLGGLFRRLHKYMSDYMSKATSSSIPRAYLCLDNVSKGRSHSRYTHKPFNLSRLNYDEKKRLLQTFLRYELFYKVEHPRVKAEGVTERTRFLAVKGGNRLQKWDLEGIRCVHEYVRSLYGAVLAHCSGVHRPEPEVQIASRASHWHFNADLYGSDLELPTIYTHNTPMLADFGFELISTLIHVATRGEKGRQKAIKWFKLFVNETGPTLKRSIPFPGGLALNFDRPRTREKDFEKTPSVCQKLFAAIRSQEWLGSAYEPSEAALRRSVFRQRAWFLLDDSRLYPRPRLSHFPLKQHMKNHSRKKSLCTQFSQTRL
ncbi:hypothetical protein MRS44_000232 [Fusarium solani]|jgi:hypothetical protein|uniref:uncharacterized protein n=1 Tax=Fusarium solani TaxID=169388 RepID=UPI0032C3FAC3|nr:hypothetical protein MRS44_000232 [Fusarium solani]